MAPVVVFSDRALVRELIVSFLERHGFPQVTGRASSAFLYRAIPPGTTGLVLVDLGNEAEDPRQVLHGLRAQRPEIILVAIGTPLQLAAQAADADGWIELSDRANRVSQVASVSARRPRGPRKASHTAERMLGTWETLTGRQRQVLALLGCGVDNRKLAAALHISERAVKAHVSALLDKFKADSRTELALIACHANLHSPSGAFPFPL